MSGSYAFDMSFDRSPVVISWILVSAACRGPDGERAPDASSPHEDAQLVCASSSSDRVWGTPGDDETGVAISPGGAIVLYGYEGSEPGVENIEPAGDAATGFVEQLGGSTSATWRWELASARSDAVDAILVRSDGTLVVAGRSRFDPEPPATRQQFDLVLVELDAEGRERWRRRLGQAPSERSRQLATDGELHAVAGYHDIYVPANHVAAWEDPYVVTWTSPGAPDARMTAIGTDWSDVVHGVAIDGATKELLLAGSTAGPEPGAFLARFAADGTPRRRTWISRGAGDAVAALRRLEGGDVIITGSTRRQLGERAFGGEDVFVARLDATFEELRWLRQLGTANSEIPVDMAVAADGRVWVVGETSGSFDDRPNRGLTDIFVAALDEHGGLHWTHQRGSPGDERPTRIAVDACDQILVAGATTGDLLGDGRSRTDYDAFLLRVPTP